MKIRICHHSTQGLQNDFKVIKNALCETEISNCVYSEYDLIYNKDIETCDHAQINIFLEHIYERYINYATYNLFIPNMEWFNKKDQQLVHKMNAILCKTSEAFVLLSKLYTRMKVFYIGFTSINRYDESISKNYNYFLHLKGISKYKNSQLLIDTWLKNPSWPTLVVIHHGVPHSNGVLHFPVPFKVGNNIIVYQCKLNENTLTQLMNQCGVHMCCSFSEGYGHYINEARSVGAYIVTTNGEPMCSFIKNGGGKLIKSHSSVKLNHGYGYNISEEEIKSTVESVLAMEHSELHNQGNINKSNFLNDSLQFKEKLNYAIKMFS